MTQPNSGFFESILLDWRERRHAARISQSLLKLYQSTATAFPNLSKRDLYRRIVALHLICDDSAAEDVLDSAEASFAAWPVSRDLTFQDVVHYLAVSDKVYSGWIRKNIGNVIETIIPEHL